MASRGNRGGGDRVLESRHVIGLFMLMLVFSGVFFALGYVMGRNQYDGQVRAASTPRATPDPVISPKSEIGSKRAKNSPWGSSSTSTANSPSASASDSALDEKSQPSSDWGFYDAGKTAPDDRLKPSAANGSPPTVNTVATSKTPARTTAVSSKSSSTIAVPAGNYVLQVAALRKEADARAVASSLQKKKFLAFVVSPTTDKYYHVQVGPYPDLKSADAAKKGLESAGFKAIVKH
jgi:cell division septation protein DedD